MSRPVYTRLVVCFSSHMEHICLSPRVPCFVMVYIESVSVLQRFGLQTMQFVKVWYIYMLRREVLPPEKTMQQRDRESVLPEFRKVGM